MRHHAARAPVLLLCAFSVMACSSATVGIDVGAAAAGGVSGGPGSSGGLGGSGGSGYSLSFPPNAG
ncbi:MAG TPA: hypothetical protein VIV60_07860, partial [Polyangiaceae bacterium]